MAEMSVEKSESLHFYKYLCQQIGSEKIVRTRRLAFNIRDLGHKMVTSGSKGEGLNLNGSDLDVMMIDSFLRCIDQTPNDSDRNLRLLYYFLHDSRTALSGVLFALEISEASMHIPEQTQYPNSLGNKNHYSRYKHDLSHLMIGLNSDAVSGLLKLASFFYVQKNYIASLTVITYTLHKYTDEEIYIYAHSCNHAVRCNHMQKHVTNLMKNEKLNTTMKSLYFRPVGSVWNLSLVPQELLLDVTSRPASFHPVSFSHFLSFLCYYRLHDITSCIQSLQQLKHFQKTLADCEFNVRCNDFVNTVIFCGIGHQLLGDEFSARHAYKEAARLDKNNVTSAALRLSRLF
ncbi:unnamed protein product [Mytilus edulis]|uniref:Uncharacterized protein n=1 Tax=Mytilus edulis TaxID=6550 RepID=A0A8S3S1V1_MYTED|nr:unnamed protein product [Mytilus edulis]